MMTRAMAALTLLVAAAGARADLATVRAEPNLEKRAEKALANAKSELAAARAAYLEKEDRSQADASLQEISDSVQLAYDSLMATGKDPRRKPKHFKRAEIKTRELMRQLDDFRAQMSALDRDVIEKVRQSLQKVHDDLLEGIMGGGRKK
jgi:hypothetical protein